MEPDNERQQEQDVKPLAQAEREDEDETLCEMIFKHKWMVLLLCAGMLTAGCGRKWEQFWGQDTRPEIRYIPMTPNQTEIPIGVMNPTVWPLSTAIRNAKWFDVWACTDTDQCIEIPEDRPEGDEMAVYVVTSNYLEVYNVKAVYPTVTKLKVQWVIQ